MNIPKNGPLDAVKNKKWRRWSSSTEQNPYPTVFTLEQVVVTFYGDILNFLILDLLRYAAILRLVSPFPLAAWRLLA